MKKAAVIPIVLATVFWGFIGYFSTTMSEAGMSVPQRLSARMTFAALALAFAILVTNPKKGFRVSLPDLGKLFLCGTITLTVNNMFYFNAIELCGMSVAAVLMYTSPIFVMIMSALVYKEKITLQKMTALVVTFVGCALVSISNSRMSADIVGIGCGIASGFTYALYSIFATDLLKRNGSTTIVMYTYLSAAVSSYFIANPIETAKILIEKDMLIYAILFGIICSALAHGLYSFGMKYTEPSLAAILATLELVMASIVGFFAYGQFLAWYNYIGIVLVMASVVLLNVKFGKAKSKE
ncbi:MAG: EamA family transporter [Clostridia bacterium]|nr:EamA family transporter [Clostridia bacterium]